MWMEGKRQKANVFLNKDVSDSALKEYMKYRRSTVLKQSITNSLVSEMVVDLKTNQTNISTFSKGIKVKLVRKNNHYHRFKASQLL